ncbi:Inner membrane protein YbjJ [Rhodobacteraceae bacterium THAF1]|uniref:MFS transporter n=1 Tax=Palleronia sp. THAF1 TaxID=2587842 RepID=UPI000F3EABCF|nr:MFS transporter [Palleronia sp. THAF1]QFU07341.1 Inner membrane protein YbjJ [Palleronia sp. THAF1]VDC20747.1 Inner membrane protein YbjJ [Rhodobacteraceae bacterium THAF1]
MTDTRPARIAATAAFCLNGLLFGIWAARIPAFVDRFALGHDTLGLLLLCIAGGAIIAFPLSGRASDRIGAARLTRVLVPVQIIALLALALMPQVWLLAPALVIFGAAYGATDVAMNGWATEVEEQRGKPILSSFHAAWSLSGGIGAVTGLALSGVAPLYHFAVIGLPAAALTYWLCRTPWNSRISEDGPVFALPRGPLVLVGIVALSSALAEGAVADWSALYLIEALSQSESRAPLGYACFSVAMVVIRLMGDLLIERLGPITATRTSGIAAVTGATMIAAAPSVAVALPGFVLLGLGLGVIFPLAFSRAAASKTMPAGQAIAAVATLGYGGILIGPPLIGAVAALTSLRFGMGVLAVLAILMIVFASAMRPAAR